MPIEIGKYKSNGVSVGSVPKGRIASVALAADRHAENKGVDQITDLMDEDYQITLARRTLEGTIGSIPVSISVESGDERAAALAEQLSDLWDKSLASMGESIAKGRVAYEKVWAFDADKSLSIIRKLEALPFSRTEMELTDDGAFDGIKLTPKSKPTVDVPSEKAWWLALDATALEPHGQSRYSGAPYQTWKHRTEARRLRGVLIRKYVLGWLVTRSDESKEDPQTGELIDMRKAMLDAVDNMRAGGAVALSNARHPETNEYIEAFETLATAEGRQQPLSAIIEEMDAEQIRSFGFSEKTVTEGSEVGSFAMVKQQAILLYAVALGILSQWAESFQQYVIDKAVAANFDEAAGVRIQIVHPKLKEQADSFIVEIVKLLLTTSELSPIIKSGAIDLGEILKQVGIPVTSDLEEKLQAALKQARQPTLPTAPPPAAFPGRFSLANEPDVPAAPDQEQLAASALAELDKLYADLLRELTAFRAGRITNDGKLRETLAAIRNLNADVRTAASTLGMLSPWQPTLTDAPSGAPRPLSLALTNVLTDGWRFPWLEEAFRFLEGKQVVRSSDLPVIAAEDRVKVFTAPGIDDESLLNELKAEIAASVQTGESLESFRGRMGETLALNRSQTETLYRTNVHQAYVEGQERSLATQGVRQSFPYVLYAATNDTRVRDEHIALDGFVVSVDDAAYGVIRNALADWNCRCALIPMNERQAQQRGIKTIADVPAEVLAKYG